jgi:FkbM family methyltransferase
MTFISYAQNFEDVMLGRALKHVEKGFYIDVGAAWPVEHSVTKAFYDMGWSGINVEPNPAIHSQLQEQRTRDVNLRQAVSDVCGRMTMNVIAGTGLSTLDASIAHQHQEGGWTAKLLEVDVTTLTDIWSSHVARGQEVHFLKVDVEGYEEAALRGNDWAANRPWIVVAEATRPSSSVEAFGEWEPILLGAGYQLAYADGLNRFYVASEHTELLQSFTYPPNVFDDFIHSKSLEAEARERRAEAMAQQAQLELAGMLASRSWRITAPLRWLQRQLHHLRQEGLPARVKATLRMLDRKRFFSVDRRQGFLKIQCLTWLQRISAPLGWIKVQIDRLEKQGLSGRIKAFQMKLRRHLMTELQRRPQLRHGLTTIAKRLGLYAFLRRLYRRLIVVWPSSIASFGELSPWAQKMKDKIELGQSRISNGAE